jgi:tripartite-type tricarboxylate transporter receptor subunit TctC
MRLKNVSVLFGVKAFVGLAASLLVAGQVFAQSGAYPEKPVKIVVGFAPGGTNDILARIVATKLGDRLKQSVVVENKPGANSAVGNDLVAKSKPDGYTLLVSSSGGLTSNPVVMKNLPYNPEKDFEPIALLGTFPLVVTTNSQLPFGNYAGLVDYAKRSREGELNHAAITSSFVLVAEMLAKESQLKLTHINYRGSGPAVSALLGGEIDFALVDIAAVMGQIKAGKLKALAVTTPKRSSALPDVPTVAEVGFKGFDATIWTALMAPKGTPEEVLSRIRPAIKEILAEKDTIDKLRTLGMEPGDTDGAALSRRISRDIRTWTDVAKRAGIKPE